MCTFFSLLGAIKINFQRIQLVKGVLSSSEHCRTDGWTAGRVEGRRGGGEAREGGKDGEGDRGNEGARKRRKEGERDRRTNGRIGVFGKIILKFFFSSSLSLASLNYTCL